MKQRKGDQPRGVAGPELEARRAQRLRTVEMLRERTPLQVIAVAEQAAALATQAIKEAHRTQPPARPLACQEGCAWCCHKLVGTSVPEVTRIVEYMRQHFSTEELNACRLRVERLEEQRRHLKNDSWQAARLPCALLVDGRCAVYPVRPLTCRGYNSSDARQCERLFESHEHVDVPRYGPQHRLTTLVLDGMRSGLSEAGLKGDLLELTAALRIALSVSDAVDRWLRGEPVFASARLP